MNTRKIGKRIITLLLAVIMCFSEAITAFAATPSITADEVQAPYLMITELEVYNAQGEKFIEIYNNSNEDINLSGYELRYWWSSATSGFNPMPFPQGSIIKAGGVKVLSNPDTDYQKLNQVYGTNLTKDDVIPMVNAGFAYNKRGVAIAKTDTKEVIASAAYDGTDAVNGKSAMYNYTGEKDAAGVPLMSYWKKQQNPTPGTADTEQIPAKRATLPDVLTAPSISTIPLVFTTQVDVNFEAAVSRTAAASNAQPLNVTMFYRTKADGAYESVPMGIVKDNSPYVSVLPYKYTATLKGDVLKGASQLEYYIEASDGTHVTRSPSDQSTYKTKVVEKEQPVNTDLMITELVPQSKDNKYSFIELYNNTNRDINLKYYRIIDQEKNGANHMWNINQDKIIKSNQTMVVWVKSAASWNEGIDKFNAVYGTNLTNDQIVTLTTPQTMYYSSAEERHVVIATDSGDTDGRRQGLVDGVSSTAWYGVKQPEALPGRSIIYRSPIDGTNRMLEINYNQDPTPGKLLQGQVPNTPMTLPADIETPVISHTPFTEAQNFSNIGSLVFHAQVTDNQNVKQVTLHYKANYATDYNTTNMILASDMNSSLPANTYINDTSLSKDQLIGADLVDYYFTASDGYNVTQSKDYTMKFQTEVKTPLEFNIANNQAFAANSVIPNLIITEIEVNNNNGRKFVEIYNSSNADIDLSNYALRYWWGSADNGFNSMPFPKNTIIKTGGVKVLSDPNTDYQKFNQLYGTNFTANDVLPIVTAGFAYSNRGVAISRTDINQVISSAAFSGTDAVDGKSVMYNYTLEKDPTGIPLMSHWKEQQNPTPGTVDPGQVPKAIVPIIANGTGDTSNSIIMKIDGNEVNALPMARQSAYISLGADGMTSSSQNRIFVNGHDAGLMGTHNNYTSFMNSIPAKFLKPGVNTIRITSGTADSPTDIAGDHDDFTLQNPFAILPDGAKVNFTNAKVKIGPDDTTYENVDLGSKVTLGDGSGQSPATARRWLDMTLNIPEQLFTDKIYNLDIAPLSDGKHTISVSSAKGQSNEISIIVDNSKPTIDNVSVKDGTAYNGEITFNANVSDAVSGIAKTEVTLDGSSIDLGTVKKSGDMAEGSHTFIIKAADKAGNEISKEVHFTTEKNKITLGEYASPISGTTGVSLSPKLSVSVSTEKNTPVDVTYYKAYQYNFSNSTQISGYTNTSTKEPPEELNPAGETQISNNDKDNLKAVDGKYVSNSSNDQFPYQRFDFKVAGDLTPQDMVEVVWNGHTLEGRTIILYTWNYKTNAWQEAARGAGAKDFQLKAKVNAGDMVKDGVVHVLVQDPINSAQNTATTSNNTTATATDNNKFTFAWFSDPQYYAESYPDIYTSMANYVVGPARQQKNILYTMNTGDIVDEYNLPYEWNNADKAFKILENAGMPYGISAGNHDINHGEVNYTEFWKNYGRDRVSKQSVFGGDNQNNRDHYDLVSSGGNDFIILYIGWDVQLQHSTIDWANKVLKQYPDRYAIVATHEYLSTDGKSYSGAGGEIWKNIVDPNSNVFLVISGHLHGIAYNEVTASDGRKVSQMLADYQGAREGGMGYMRFFEFDMAQKKLHVETYSPYVNSDHYFDEAKENFDIDISGIVKSPEKRVDTDYVGVNVYTNNEIGKVQNAASGSRPEVQWNGLESSSQYFWYAKAEDANGNAAYSDIQNFVTINPTLASASLTSDSTNLERTKTAKLSVKGKLNNNVDADLSKAAIQYTSSNPSIAFVDEKGVVTANKVGSADITAIVTLDGIIVQSNAVTITVGELNMDAIQLGINPDKQLVGAGEELQVKLNAKGAKNLYGFDSTFSYDPNLFELKSVTADKDFAADSSKAYLDYKDDNGKVRIVTSLTGVPEGVTGDVNVIDIKLKAKTKDGKTSLVVSKGAKVSDSNGAIFTAPEDVVSELTVANADVTGGGVAINDLVLVARAFGTSSNSQGYNAAFDMNKDGVIDIVDISYVAKKVLGI